MEKKKSHFTVLKLAVLRLFGIRSKQLSVLEEEAVTSPTVTMVKNYFRNPVGIIGLVGFVLIALVISIGARTTSFDPYYSQGVLKNISPGFGYLDFPKQLEAEGVEDIQSGTTYSVGLSKEGNVFLWGQDYAGTLTPSAEILQTMKDEKVDFIASGDKHVLVHTKAGQFLGWGNNEFNQCRVPKEVADKVAKEGLKKMAASDQYSVILTGKGNIFVWGSVMNNKLDRIPIRLENKVVDFVNSPSNIIVLLDDGTIDYFGGKGGQLTDAFPAQYKKPSKKDIKEGKAPKELKTVKQIAMTVYSGALIDENDELFLWGSAIESNLIPPEFDSKVIDIQAGRNYFVARTESGRIYSWGKDNYGVISQTPPGENYQKLFCHYFENYALDQDGAIKAWGLDGFVAGTDDSGRNQLIRLIHGGKITLLIAAISVLISLLIGVSLGMISGFYGGMIDNLIMRFAEIVASLPFLPLVITLSAILPAETSQNKRLFMVMVILGVLGWTGIARLVRGQILAEREKDYILAAKALGLKEKKIIVSHILPNIVSVIIVQATIGYASNLLTEAGLSFLGFGVKAPYPSWGNMMTGAQSSEVIRRYWWRWVYPASAVFLTALNINLMGDALRDAIDPKSSER